MNQKSAIETFLQCDNYNELVTFYEQKLEKIQKVMLIISI